MEAELKTATEAAREAGQILLRHYGGALKVSEKSVDNPVTAADLEANEALKTKILGAFPGDGWLSEETADSDERLKQKRVWIIDPLDGTKEFISEIPEFVVCVALVEDGAPRVAVEYNPVRDELFTAVKGRGAFLNGQVIHVSKQVDLRHAHVLASRSEEARGEWDPYQEKMHVELTGSVAYKFALVASGRFDATFTLTPKNEWDVCAGSLLVAEAGGMVTDPDGRAIRFNNPSTLLPGLVASNQLLHRSILNTVRTTRAAME
ncbi:MAG TPA: 3'(2'),5'-bisphosphate nucleotidase CysQ [Candidatus Binatia bacterium]|jgi:myo-inositol-1(or 4)-monophosphatase